MTETIPIPQNIAEAVRHSRGPTGNMAELSAQAQRLRKALEVSQAWERAAGSSSEMLAHATYTADKLEEELSGVIWQMEVLHNLSEYRRAHRDLGTSEAGGTGELDEERTRAAHLSNTLLHIYCTLSDAPLDIFGVGERVAEERTRYVMMGALLAAMDLIPDKVEAKDVQDER